MSYFYVHNYTFFKSTKHIWKNSFFLAEQSFFSSAPCAIEHGTVPQSRENARLFLQSSEWEPSPTGECVPSFGSGGARTRFRERGVPIRKRRQTLWYSRWALSSIPFNREHDVLLFLLPVLIILYVSGSVSAMFVSTCKPVSQLGPAPGVLVTAAGSWTNVTYKRFKFRLSAKSLDFHLGIIWGA